MEPEKHRLTLSRIQVSLSPEERKALFRMAEIARRKGD